jgi:uncharacterized repeat protein (TIGR02543 family)
MKKIKQVLLALAVALMLIACTQKPVSISINFDSNGGSDVEGITYDGKSFEMPDNPTKDGYTFEGWYFDNETFIEEFTINSVLNRILEDSFTVYAKWSSNDELTNTLRTIYELALDAEAFSGTYEEWLETVKGPKGEDGKEVVLEILDGYIKWKYSEAETWTNLISLSELKGKDGLSAYELYVVNFPDYEKTETEWLHDLLSGQLIYSQTWNVSFDYNIEGINLATLETSHLSKITEPSNYEKEGYTFDGWYYGDEKWSFIGYVVTEDITLTAKWNSKPIIDGFEPLTINMVEDYSPLEEVVAFDEEDGDLTNLITVDDTLLNLQVNGTYQIFYEVTDSFGNTVVYSRYVIVDIPALEPTEIVIMHGAPYEVDPFHPDYSGTDQLSRQALQREVEERLNVTVKYQAYPASAAWGPSRITAIINSSVVGEPLADIYWTTSDWIQQLADGNAIVPVDQYMNTQGSNIHEDFIEVGSYQDHVYGFGANNLTVDVGLYYNADLVASLGVDNPSQLYLDGLWTWSEFEDWATEVQTALSAQGTDYFALGGVPSAYAESMVPLNGGRLINAITGEVTFAQNSALDTYTFLSDLWTQGLFEPSGQYDAGSPLWQTGKVAMHPGSLWFVNAANRWSGLAFELGFVPYPMSDAFKTSGGQYVSPVSGVAVYNVASGMTPEKEELVFQVWNELQLWKTDQELYDEFQLELSNTFEKQLYIDTYMTIYDKTFYNLIYSIGISPYGENGWRSNINAGIRNGTARLDMDRIKPIYDAALDQYYDR